MPSDYVQITADNIDRRGREFDDIGRFLSEQLYSDRTHFVYELLQNAEDALGRRLKTNPDMDLPKCVSFNLFKDRLEFRHYGQPFTTDDVKGICDVLKGTKSNDLNQIGKFGIGFKSVYAFSATPEIYSGDEHFIIERFIRPELCQPKIEIDGDETVFVFPFNHARVDPASSFRLIASKLQSIGSRVLLFLKNIESIDWSVENRPSRGTYSKEVKQNEAGWRVKLFTKEYLKKEIEYWTVFERFVEVPRSDPRCETRKNASIEIAFRLIPKTGPNGFKGFKVLRASQAPLVVFFPTEKQTHLGFLIQGPYITTPSRDNVPQENEWNKSLVKTTAKLIPECLFHFKKSRLMSTDLLEALPINPNDFPDNNMFRPIYNSVQQAFVQSPLLPTEDGDFVCAKQAKLSRGADLKKLFNNDQLQDLFRSALPLFWLPTEITQDRRPEVRSYLIEELDIEEITPEIAARKLTKAFLQKQSDGWFADFYQFLDDHKDLWEKPNSILRKKEILRLADNSLVKPFNEDGRPKAYLPTSTKTKLPCVKGEIAGHRKALSFLKRLGIMEPDLFSEVTEFILPKYSASNPVIEYEDNIQDLKVICRLLQKQSFGSQDSIRAKMRILLAQFGLEEHLDIFESYEDVGIRHFLLKTFKSIPFFRASGDGNPSTFFRSAEKIYLLSPELSMYFEGNGNVWFLDSNYPDEIVKLCQQLGCAEFPRIESTEENAQGHVVVRDQNRWHERGLDGFDPRFSVDGLGYALTHPTIAKSAYIWNELAIPNSKKIRGELESSTRKDYANSSREMMHSKMGSLLLDSKWIPGLDGRFRKPKDFPVEKLPKEFRKDETLCDILGMRVNEVEVLAAKYGVKAEHINFIKHHLEEFKKWKTSVINRPSSVGDFPEVPSRNSERREEKFQERLSEAPDKLYDTRTRNVRVSKGLVDHASTWLKGKYTNKQGYMTCQICKQVMPFKKPNGEYYFEAVEITDQSHIEHEELYLALCPTCAAKYKVFVKKDSEKMDEVTRSILKMEGPEININLDKPNASIRFVDVHLSDLKTIFSKSQSIGDGRSKNFETELERPLVSISKQSKLADTERKSEPEVIYKGESRNVQHPKELVQCPHCHSQVRADRLEGHIERVHSIEPDKRALDRAAMSPKIPPRRKNRKKSSKAPAAWRPGRCRSCGVPAVPGSDYCYSCG